MTPWLGESVTSSFHPTECGRQLFPTARRAMLDAIESIRVMPCERGEMFEERPPRGARIEFQDGARMSVAEGDARELTAISWQFKPGRSDRPELTQCECLSLSQFSHTKFACERPWRRLS